MREAAFVKQNKDKWLTFEKALGTRNSAHPEFLSDLYIEITDHLSYANTFYPQSETARYLNSLAAKVHHSIYKNKKESGNRVLDFWKTELPLLFYNYQKHLLFTFLFFALFVAIGAYSAAEETDFVRAILGDAYVDMTLDNIKKGDPMAVYKEMNAFDMFLGITINNVMVAFKAFVYGILLGLGTLLILMYNGVMLGSFQYFFYEQGLLWESVRTIWIHGTIEISVIIIAGCAGLVMGSGLLFPRTHSRLYSFKKGVKDGIKIVSGTVPFFIIAGFLEGFVTRHTGMPDALALFIILGSLAVIIYYFVVYPHKLARKNKIEKEKVLEFN